MKMAQSKSGGAGMYSPDGGMIIARLVERIEINHDYEVEIKFRISV